MRQLTFSGKIKVPRAKGRATVQKMSVETGSDGQPVFSPAGDPDEETNVVLDQCMAMYGAYHDLGGNNDPASYHQTFSIAFGNLVSTLVGSDDGTAPSAATTATAGTVYQFGHSVSKVMEDAGDLGGGVEYTRVTFTGTLYVTSLVNYTLRKLYLRSGPAPTNKVPFLAQHSPTTELLLASPILIEDGEKEAVKVTYEVLFPRMGVAANLDHGRIACGSGTIQVQDRALDDTVTAGPTIGWTMIYCGHKDSSTSPPTEPCITNLSTPTISTATDGATKVSAVVGGHLDASRARDNVSASVSYPTATSVKYTTTQIISRIGNPDTSWDCTGIMFLWTDNTTSWGDSNSGGSPWWIEFDQILPIDWTETLEIHAELTIDWS